MIASAPGKLMVAGEYAVLARRPCLVMAVDRRVRVRRRAAGEGVAAVVPPEAVGAWEVAVEEGMLNRVPEGERYHYDLDAVGRDGQKLGVGSSAALAAASLCVAMAEEGRTLAVDGPERARFARVVRRGHQRAQPRGSGVDALASAMGGLLQVTLPEGPSGEALIERLVWPEGLHWAVLWSGSSVKTHDMLHAVGALAGRDRALYDRRMGAIGDAGEAACAAFRASDCNAIVAALDAQGAAMEALGIEAGVPIVPDSLASLARAARPLGVAVKPSGAGGGDVALAVAYSPEALTHVIAHAVGGGFQNVMMRSDAVGATVVGG